MQFPKPPGMPMPPIAGPLKPDQPILETPEFKKGDRVHLGQSPFVLYVIAGDRVWTTLKVPGHSEPDAIFEVKTRYLLKAD